MKLHGNESKVWKLTNNQHKYHQKIYQGGAYFYHVIYDFLFETVDHAQKAHSPICHLGVLFSAAYVFLRAPMTRNPQNH